MTIQEFIDYISSAFSRLPPRKTERHIETILNTINIHRQDPFYMSTHKPFVSFDKKSISGFKLTSNDTSIPVIVGMDRNKNLVVTAQISRPYKTNTGIDRGSPSVKMMKSSQLSDESRKILNKNEFRNGLDIDNFKLVNAPDLPIEDALSNGAIVPLNSKEGVFLPKFVSFVHNMSMERETSVKLPRSFDMQRDIVNYVSDKIKEHFPIPMEQLLSHNLVRKLTPEELVNGMERPYDGTLTKVYIDGTVYNRPSDRIYGTEMVFGTANLPNAIYFNYLLHKTLTSSGLIPTRLKKQYPNNGFHINVGMYNENFNSDRALIATNAYFDIVGKTLLSTALTDKRLRRGNQSWFYIPDVSRYNTSIGRSFYRTARLRNSQVLEFRYPQNMIDTGYIANQLILANKAITDISLLMGDNLDELQQHAVYSRVSGLSSIVSKRNSEEYRNFLAKNFLGIDDSATLKWFHDFVKKCESTR